MSVGNPGHFSSEVQMKMELDARLDFAIRLASGGGESSSSNSNGDGLASGGQAGTKEGGKQPNDQPNDGEGEQKCKNCPVGPFSDGDNSALESNGLLVNFVSPEDHNSYRALAEQLKGKIGKDKVVLISHGTGTTIVDDRGGATFYLVAGDVQKMLMSDYPEYSKMMKHNKAGTTVYLVGCHTASVAKELSRQGMTVVGTTGFLFPGVTNGNQMNLSGVSSSEVQNLNDRGWVTYQNGSQVGSIAPGNYYYNLDKFR